MGLFKRKSKPMGPSCSMVVVAAGSSTRMGQDKILLDLDGIPVIMHTLRALEACSSVKEIVVVTREDLVAQVAGLCRDFRLTKVTKVVRGGANRVESARLGTLEVNQDAALIGIHDGARPFVTCEVVDCVVDQAARTGAAAPAIPVRDTIKLARDGVVDSTPDRSQLYAVQTPQVFDGALIRAALQKALEDGAVLTDDCSAVERMGMKVVLTQGDERNIKLTTPMDMAVAGAMLEGGLV